MYFHVYFFADATVVCVHFFNIGLLIAAQLAQVYGCCTQVIILFYIFPLEIFSKKSAMDATQIGFFVCTSYVLGRSVSSGPSLPLRT